MANRISESQERFCQEIMLGKTQRQAYYAAYPNSVKSKPECVDSRACILLSKDKVAARLAELRGKTEESNQITRDTLIWHLKKIGFSKIDEENIKPSDKIKALEIIAKILGYDKPEVINVTVSNNPFANLSEDELRKLAEHE